MGGKRRKGGEETTRGERRNNVKQQRQPTRSVPPLRLTLTLLLYASRSSLTANPRRSVVPILPRLRLRLC